MSTVNGRKIEICVALLYVLSAVGCGVGTEQSEEIQTAQMQVVGVSDVESAEEAHIEDITDSTQDAQVAEEDETVREAQEAGEKQYPIFADVPAEMYLYLDADDEDDNRHYRIINAMGEPGGGAVVFVSEDTYRIFDTVSGTYGFLSEHGDVIAPFGYEEAYPFHEGTACVRGGDKFGYIGMNGETVLPFIYDRAAPFSEGLAYFAVGDTYGFMDESGEPVFYLDCESVSSFREGRAYIYKDGKYGYIDSTGTVVIEPAYDDATYFNNGVAIVREGGYYGAIGLNGEEIVPAIYENSNIPLPSDGDLEEFGGNGQRVIFDYMEGRVDDCYKIKGEGEDGRILYGIADSEGEIILQPIYGSASYNNEDPLIYGSEHIIIMRGDGETVNDCIVKTAPTEVDGLSAEILVNEITPGSAFYKYANAETFDTESFYDNLSQIDIHMLDARKISRRLYGNVGSGTLLYLSMESYDWLLSTDYYALLGEDAVEKGSACVYESDNGGGYEYGLWYDEQEQKLVQGRAWHYGGSGNVAGRDFFEEQNGNLVIVNSWAYAYDRYEVVTTYTVNDKEATEEEYEAMRARYRWIENLE